jgi:PAS domain S-box-containing protein
MALMEQASEDQSRQDLMRGEAKFKTIANAIPQMVWSTLPDGSHDYYNDQWYDYTGIEAGKMHDEEWDRLLHPDDQVRAWNRWCTSLDTGAPYEIEYRLRHKSGQFRWTLSRALPIRDEHGAIARWMGTCTDIHEQKLAQEHLQQADRRKDEFLAMLAHELRNPLAPISSAAVLLAMETLPPPRVRQISEVIYRQTRHIASLIDDLTDVSRVTRGLVQLEEEPVDVKSALLEAYEQVRPLIEQKRHHVETSLTSESALVRGDHKRLVQVAANLLCNAAKYTSAGGVIVLRLAGDSEDVAFSIEDNGIGMAPEFCERCFDLFVQGKRSLDRSEGGLGVGLALVRSLVEQHGGKVGVFSEGMGRGSRFTVTIPRLQNEDRERRRHTRAVPLLASSQQKLAILIVDDNVDAAQLLGLMFQQIGHETHIAYSAQAALAQAADCQPDVCILDIGLGDGNGIALAGQLRLLPEAAKAALIAVTGHSQPQGRERAFAAGFDYFFVKPVDPAVLADLLTEIAAARKLIR